MASELLSTVAAMPLALTATSFARMDSQGRSGDSSTVFSGSLDRIESAKSNQPDAPIDTLLSDVRPVIERLDGARDIAKVLGPEPTIPEDRALQADAAYKDAQGVTTDTSLAESTYV